MSSALEAPQSASELCSPTLRRTSAWRSAVAQKALLAAVSRRVATRFGSRSLAVTSDSVVRCVFIFDATCFYGSFEDLFSSILLVCF